MSLLGLVKVFSEGNGIEKGKVRVAGTPQTQKQYKVEYEISKDHRPLDMFPSQQILPYQHILVVVFLIWMNFCFYSFGVFWVALYGIREVRRGVLTTMDHCLEILPAKKAHCSERILINKFVSFFKNFKRPVYF